MTAVGVHPAAFVDPSACLDDGVTVGPGAVIGPDVRIGAGTRVGSHALLTGWTTIGRDCRVHHGAVIGSPPQDLKYPGGRSYLEVGDRTEIREYATLNIATEPEATTRVGRECLLMAYAHVGHNCHVGDHVILANVVQLAGYVTIDDWAILGGGTLVHQFVRIGRHAMIGGASRVTQDIAPFVKAAGSPPRLAGINGIGLERRGVPPAARTALGQAYRVLFRGGMSVGEAVVALRREFAGVAEVEHLARFAETSLRGITR